MSKHANKRILLARRPLSIPRIPCESGSSMTDHAYVELNELRSASLVAAGECRSVDDGHA
jgi:hypothetical protein